MGVIDAQIGQVFITSIADIGGSTKHGAGGICSNEATSGILQVVVAPVKQECRVEVHRCTLEHRLMVRGILDYIVPVDQILPSRYRRAARHAIGGFVPGQQVGGHTAGRNQVCAEGKMLGTGQVNGSGVVFHTAYRFQRHGRFGVAVVESGIVAHQ